MSSSSCGKRSAVGAGRWFPGSKASLTKSVAAYVDSAKIDLALATQKPAIGVMAPHAGYEYSGKCAGFSFRALLENSKVFGVPETVVVLGFSHRGSFKGTALMDGTEFTSPIGTSLLDVQAAQKMCKGRSSIKMDYRPHNGEHSAENEVPFVQHIFPSSKLVIALIGDHDEAAMDQLVDAIIELRGTETGKNKVVLVSSSDMLHDADWNLVSKTDRETLPIVAAGDVAALSAKWSYDFQVLCGVTTVMTLMKLSNRLGGKGHVLHYENSGDEHPESRGDWVVGYGSVAFF